PARPGVVAQPARATRGRDPGRERADERARARGGRGRARAPLGEPRRGQSPVSGVPTAHPASDPDRRARASVRLARALLGHAVPGGRAAVLDPARGGEALAPRAGRERRRLEHESGVLPGRAAGRLPLLGSGRSLAAAESPDAAPPAAARARGPGASGDARCERAADRREPGGVAPRHALAQRRTALRGARRERAHAAELVRAVARAGCARSLLPLCREQPGQPVLAALVP